MLQPALSIVAMVRDPFWPAIKRQGAFTVAINNSTTSIQIISCPTKIGSLFYLRCPRCKTQRRNLFLVGGELGCRACHHVLHEDQRLSSGRWSQKIIRRARQIRRITNRLARSGPDKVTRRRWRRRRTRLLEELQVALEKRKSKSAAQLKNILGEIALAQ